MSERNAGLVIPILLDDEGLSSRLLAEALTRSGRFRVAERRVNESLLQGKHPDPGFEVALLTQSASPKVARECDMARQLIASWPATRIVILYEQLSREFVVEAFRSGVHGFFHRYEPFESLCECIASVHGGRIWATIQELDYLLASLREPLAGRIVNQQGINLLSKREEQIVRCVADGLNNREIAEKLAISIHTVKNNLFRIFDKLGVSNRVELTVYAVAQGALGLVNGPSVGPEPIPNTGEEGTCAFPPSAESRQHNGNGLPLDPIGLYSYLSLADKMGAEIREIGQATLRALEVSMTPGQLNEAKRRVDVYLKASAMCKQARSPKTKLSGLAA